MSVKTPQLAAFITHQSRQAAFCFIPSFLLSHRLSSYSSLNASSQPFSGHSEVGLMRPFQLKPRIKRSGLPAALVQTPRSCVYLTFILGLLTESAADRLRGLLLQSG